MIFYARSLSPRQILLAVSVVIGLIAGNVSASDSPTTCNCLYQPPPFETTLIEEIILNGDVVCVKRACTDGEGLHGRCHPPLGSMDSNRDATNFTMNFFKDGMWGEPFRVSCEELNRK